MSGPLDATGHRGYIRPQLEVVVYLPIQDEDELSIAGRHRLMPGGRQVENRQPPEADCGAGRFIDPYALIVRAAVAESFRHCLDHGTELGSFSGRVENAREAAHRSVF
jgi:hypothetical protein